MSAVVAPPRRRSAAAGHGAAWRIAALVLAALLPVACGGGGTSVGCEAPGEGATYVVSRHSGLCLEALSYAVEEGGAIGQSAFRKGANQRWKLLPSAAGGYRLRNVHSDLCIDAGDAAGNGEPAHQRACSDAATQAWKLEPGEGGACRLVNVASGRCLEVLEYSMLEGAAVGTWQCHSGENQRWELHVGGYESSRPPVSR